MIYLAEISCFIEYFIAILQICQSISKLNFIKILSKQIMNLKQFIV